MITRDGPSVRLKGNSRQLLVETVTILLAAQTMLRERLGDKPAKMMMTAIYETAMDDDVQEMAKDYEMSGTHIDMKELLRQLGEGL